MVNKGKQLKTMDEHNKATIKTAGIAAPIKNGIACPECGNELTDTSPNKTWLKETPKKGVVCDKCGYSGFRDGVAFVDADKITRYK